MKSILATGLMLLLYSSYLYSQTGKEFWFAVPYVDKTHDFANGDNTETGPNYFRISTGQAGAIVNFYYYPGGGAANEAVLYTVNVAANSVEDVVLQDGTGDINLTDFTNSSYSTINDRGIFIQSNNPITIYYEIGSYNNTDIFSLKAKDALGTEFYPSFQTQFENEVEAAYATDSWASVDIVATEDGTDVTIELPASVMTSRTEVTTDIYKGGYNYNSGYYSMDPGPFYQDIVTREYENDVVVSETHDITWYVTEAIRTDPSYSINWDAINSSTTVTTDHPVQYPSFSTTTVTLDKGETYAVKASSRDAVKNISGVHITATKPIAVTGKDDSVLDDVGYAADVVGDQNIPVDNAGSKYIIPDFNTGGDIQQYAFLRAIVDNTELYDQDGYLGTLDAGEVLKYTGFDDDGTYKYIYEANDKSFFCFQITGYIFAGSDTELGGAVLPPVDRCTGSTQCAFNRPQADAEVALISRTNEVGTFYYNDGSGWTSFTPANFTGIDIDSDGTDDWYFTFDVGFAITTGVNYLVKNTKKTFHLGLLSKVSNGAGEGTFYGYFSDFTEPDLQLGFDFRDHDSDPGTPSKVYLFAFGGVEGSYNWEMVQPSPAGTDCEDHYFEAVAAPGLCDTANPMVLSDDILVTNDFYRYYATGESTCDGSELDNYVQFEVIDDSVIVVQLPIELQRFEATCSSGNSVALQWNTASELNNDYFTIERSSDGITFLPVGVIDGAGTISSENRYSYLDVLSAEGVYYYRLKQTDFNGNVTYSKIVVVFVGAVEENIIIYPTKVNAGFNIFVHIENVEAEAVFISQYSMQGVCIYQDVYGVNGNDIPIEPILKSGVYEIVVEYSGLTHRQKVVVE